MVKSWDYDTFWEGRHGSGGIGDKDTCAGASVRGAASLFDQRPPLGCEVAVDLVVWILVAGG